MWSRGSLLTLLWSLLYWPYLLQSLNVYTLCFMHSIFLIIRSETNSFSSKISSLVCPSVKCQFFVLPSLNDPSISQSPSHSLYRDHFLKVCLNTIFYFEKEDRNLFRNVRAVSLTTWRRMTGDNNLQYVNVYWNRSYEISAERDFTGFSFCICP